MRDQYCLQTVSSLIRCHSQRFKLKPQHVIKLALAMIIRTQSLNRSCPVSDRSIISDCFEQSVGLIRLPLSMNSESVIIETYLSRSIDGQAHQHSAYFLKRIQ